MAEQKPPRRAYRKWIRITLISFGLIVLLIATGGFLLYRATQKVPDFYIEALEADPVLQETANDQMLQKVTTLANDLREEGHWEARFTEEQINGWLAIDMVRNHPDFLPPYLAEPRVVIQPEAMSLACRFAEGKIESVLNLSVDAYIAEPNVVAIRIRQAQAGALPVPLSSLLDKVTEVAEQMNHHIRWTRTDGDPVALISIASLHDEKDCELILDDLRLGDGEIYLSGTSAKPSEP